jgi:dTDP-4-dehydrorhamnose reductase
MPASEHERPRLLLFGSTGQLGRELKPAFADIMEVEASVRGEADMTRGETLRQTIAGFEPDWIINAAAYTAVDRAETELEVAQAVNADAVRVIGEEAQRIGAGVIHYSTDYVFDGSKESAYVENDSTTPVNAYGRTKLAGELALRNSGAAHIIFRVSWLYGARGNNFLRTILRLAHSSASSSMPIRIVNDQQGTPTWTGDVTAVTRKVIKRITKEARTSQEAGDEKLSIAKTAQQYNGVYHLTGIGETTWYGFAAEALQQLRMMKPDARFARVVPITTAEYPTPARRPKNSRLDAAKLEAAFGIKLPLWQESLAKVLEELIADGGLDLH